MNALELRYFDRKFINMERRIMGKLDELKAEVDGLRADLEAADGRDTEDVAEMRRRIDELTAQLGAADADAATLLPRIQELRAKVQGHDLDPAFPAARPPDGPPAP